METNTTFKKSFKLLGGLVVSLVILNTALIFMPQGNFGSTAQSYPVALWIVTLVVIASTFVIYGGLAIIGFLLTRRVGIADIIDPRVTLKQRFLHPAQAGALAGIALVYLDILFSKYNLIGKLPHPPFPTSIFASMSAAIGEEIIFRLFFVTFFTWLISSIILRKKLQKTVYWIMSIVSALLFGFGHFAVLLTLYGFPTISSVPALLQFEILLLNGLVSLVAAYYFRKSGFIAAVGVHFWTDIVWHVFYGLL